MVTKVPTSSRMSPNFIATRNSLIVTLGKKKLLMLKSSSDEKGKQASKEVLSVFCIDILASSTDTAPAAESEEQFPPTDS